VRRAPVGGERPQHLRVGYHRELDAIDQKVVRLFALVSEAVAAANEALLAGDTEALATVRSGETTIDELMAELEHDIERLLLLQAPVAGELRYALTLIRIVPELERSGDLAVHIAKRSRTGLAAQLTPAARGALGQPSDAYASQAYPSAVAPVVRSHHRRQHR